MATIRGVINELVGRYVVSRSAARAFTHKYGMIVDTARRVGSVRSDREVAAHIAALEMLDDRDDLDEEYSYER